MHAFVYMLISHTYLNLVLLRFVEAGAEAPPLVHSVLLSSLSFARFLSFSLAFYFIHFIHQHVHIVSDRPRLLVTLILLADSASIISLQLNCFTTLFYSMFTGLLLFCSVAVYF